MSNLADLSSLDDMSGNETVKATSNHLRGLIKEELLEDTPAFGDASETLLKFHGIYQQDDRDRRKEARSTGLDKHHQLMIRTRIPGGVVSADAYIAHDEISRRWANGTLRVTTRQDFQLHGVLKGDIKKSIRTINDALLTTLGGCGDVERNIMCCPEPVADRFHDEVNRAIGAIVAELTPRTRAYHEIWLDGEVVKTSEPEVEPLYREQYLPRKFKTTVALDGDNCVDVYAHDLSLVAMRSAEGTLRGFNALVGGGLGRTHNKPETFVAAALPLCFVEPDQVVDLAREVVAVQRDYGDRTNRRHARLKYTIADRGLDWFRDEVQSRVTFRFQPPEPLCSAQLVELLSSSPENKWIAALGFASVVRDADTLVGLMALGELFEVAAALAGAVGGSRPAAVISNATLPNQRSVSGTLDRIASLASEAAIEAPATLVVGDVVAVEQVVGLERLQVAL